MKRVWILVFTGLIALFTACSPEKQSKHDHLPKTVVETVSEREVPTIAALGDSVAKTLLQTLKTELITTIKKSGPLEAIKVCNTKALPLTQQVAHQFGAQVKIKRTSFKIRNPQNAPDSLELKALQYFAQQLETQKALPSHYIQKIRTNGKVRYRYYMPLKVAGLCVNCHGDPQHIPEKVKQELHRLYPNDKAVGYQVGDFRGVIRVEISSVTTE